MNQVSYFVLAVAGVSSLALYLGVTPVDIAVVGFSAFSAIIVAFAAAVLYKIIKGEIDLDGIISEPDDVAKRAGKPKASLSRFQFLVFTFVIAGLFLMLSIESGDFVEVPNTVLGLLGLSGGSYIVSKAVGQQGKPGKRDEDKKPTDNEPGEDEGNI